MTASWICLECLLVCCIEGSRWKKSWRYGGAGKKNKKGSGSKTEYMYVNETKASGIVRLK